MKIRLVGSTNNIKTKEEALQFGAAAARICYSEKDFDTLLEEDKTKLIERTLSSGHHSVYDHIQFNFYFEDIPKIGAMLLNNEKYYATSEKSARYTQMDPEPYQKGLYDRWMGIFQEEISKKYPQLNKTKIIKLAQENARYMISVFTPTKMLHTLSFRQLNYIMNYFDEFLIKAPNTNFNFKIKEFMRKFNDNGLHFKDLYIQDLKSMNDRHLSFLSQRKNYFAEEFGENYSTSYSASLACLAQLHRHRTINYEIQPIKEGLESRFFIPALIRDRVFTSDRWVKDLASVSEYDHPQGMLVDIHETGNYKDFISKMCERLCGHAQWEIMSQTKKTLDNYLDITRKTNPSVYNDLVGYSKGPRCTFPTSKCRSPCEFGKELGLERLI